MLCAAGALAFAAAALAAEPASLLAGYPAEVHKSDAAFNPSAQRGEQFFNPRHASVDANRDGFVSRQEAWADSRVEQRFGLADRNQDGKLDRAELDEALKPPRQ